jgi:hypothetical protein
MSDLWHMVVRLVEYPRKDSPPDTDYVAWTVCGTYVNDPYVAPRPSPYGTCCARCEAARTDSLQPAFR